MAEKIIGRDAEKKILQDMLASGEGELIAILGRRRVDLLLDRQDHCINLCEMKFSANEFVINKQYAEDLDNKVKVFRTQTKTNKAIFPTMITTYGVMKNDYYNGLIQSEVLMKDLFSQPATPFIDLGNEY